MTDMTTRRGVRPLLALLLTGMALLMMGAARPVMASTATASISLDTAGWVTAPDQVSWNAGVTYSGPSGSIDMDYHVDCTITFYSGSTSVGTMTIHNVSPTTASGGSPIGVHSSFSCSAGASGLAIMSAYTNITGFKWSYHIEVEAVDDENTSSASKYADTETQQYGAFEDTGGGDNPVL